MLVRRARGLREGEVERQPADGERCGGRLNLGVGFGSLINCTGDQAGLDPGAGREIGEVLYGTVTNCRLWVRRDCSGGPCSACHPRL
ncbi:hypothetical protein GWI33_013106 [Rhynchophorus ferrugineus]|uniref:Uncharacterized protein n=1 Tax=Rhynchophorus ferrugineus TaxID=354439 RepID=A0A834M852_RHYFE|nr:hypothetical protein GWI33_013106 [Rhynchophorus ferrugineus]